MAKTLYDKVWQAHIIDQIGEDSLIYIDRHLIHEVTSPQAFAGLNEKGRKVRRPDRTVGTMDHSISTRSLAIDACGPANALQLQTLAKNCEEHGIQLFPVGHQKQGIVHVMGPELGLIQPGMTVVCGDSHTATHGAFGALAFGIGTSQVEHVLATQTLKQSRAKSMLINVNGKLPVGITAKDIILAIIGKIGHAGATGHVIEYAGEAIRGLSMEERMTVCNMSIEAGAKAGLVAPDEKTFAYLEGREYAPKGQDWEDAVAYWKTLYTEEGATFDTVVELEAADIAPQVTWGTNPGQVIGVNTPVPAPEDFSDPIEKESAVKALEYMGLKPGEKLADVAVNHVFIGSCTNGRIEDMRAAAAGVSAILDVEDPLPEAYHLEVSSPGIDRPLTRLKDFEKWSGFEAKVELQEAVDGQRRYRGKLLGIENDNIVVLDSAGDKWELPFVDLRKAKLVLTDELIAASQSNNKS